MNGDLKSLNKWVSTKYTLLVIISLAYFTFAPMAESNRDQRDLSRNGAMSMEQLRCEPITFELDIPYDSTKNPRHRLDLYLPKNSETNKLPVIVFIHGGGWMQGDKADGAGRLLPFVRSGKYAGISIGYRLSKEVKWPAQIQDCKAAIRWIRTNASRYNLDSDRIAVMGRSAGGHLALMLGVSGDVPELEGQSGPDKTVGSEVRCVANFFGVADFLALIEQPSHIDRTRADAPEAKLIGGPLQSNEDNAKSASPITYITPNDTPILTIHGTADDIVPYDQAVRLHEAMKKAGVPSYLVTIKGGGHGDFGVVAEDRIMAFFGKYLLGSDEEISTATIDYVKK